MSIPLSPGEGQARLRQLTERRFPCQLLLTRGITSAKPRVTGKRWRCASRLRALPPSTTAQTVHTVHSPRGVLCTPCTAQFFEAVFAVRGLAAGHAGSLASFSGGGADGAGCAPHLD